MIPFLLFGLFYMHSCIAFSSSKSSLSFQTKKVKKNIAEVWERILKKNGNLNFVMRWERSLIMTTMANKWTNNIKKTISFSLTRFKNIPCKINSSWKNEKRFSTSQKVEYKRWKNIDGFLLATPCVGIMKISLLLLKNAIIIAMFCARFGRRELYGGW